jgi:hypothetical protein
VNLVLKSLFVYSHKCSVVLAGLDRVSLKFVGVIFSRFGLL